MHLPAQFPGLCVRKETQSTKEGQTADAYIEKTTHERSSDSFVRVVSSDMQEQLMILGSGGFRVSAREFRRECECTVSEIKEAIESYGS